MKASFYSPVLATLLSFLLVSSTSPLLGQGMATPKVKKIPFHGKLLSVDVRTQTITIAGKTPRIFHLTPTTRITDGSGNPSNLASAIVGEDVGGSYIKEPAGAMTLFSVRFGAKTGEAASIPSSAPMTMPTSRSAPPTPPSAAPPLAPTSNSGAATAATMAAAPAAQPKKQTFSGKVVSVNAATNTLVIHGKTDHVFTLSPTTKIVDANGNASNLSNLIAGTKVHGTYLQSPDGMTRTLYTLKIGK